LFPFSVFLYYVLGNIKNEAMVSGGGEQALWAELKIARCIIFVIDTQRTKIKTSSCPCSEYLSMLFYAV
jgi:hypothetical protein